MSDRSDAYKVLQVDPEADPEVIQAAYRRLAQKFHPDRAGSPDTPEGRDAAKRMVAINAAWEILGDERRRAAYDRQRAAQNATGGPGTAPGSAPVGSVRPEPAHPGSAHSTGWRTHAGPSAGSGHAAGAVPDGGPADPDRLTFGRFAGWRLEDILRADPGYLEWLDRTPAGRPYRAQIDVLLRRSGRRTTRGETSRGLPRRP